MSGEGFLSTRETAAKQRLNPWPGIFSSEDLRSAVNIGVRHAETAHTQCLPWESTSAIPALEQSSRKDNGSNGILCCTEIARSAWAAEGPVLKIVTPNQAETKGRFSSLCVHWFHYRDVESGLNFTLLPRGLQARDGYCSFCFILKN